MSAPSPHAPTRDLLTSLSRAGWGDLAGYELQGVRSTLRAVVDLLPYGSGQGLVTTGQIADTAGISRRWVQRCLHYLEDAGLIMWTRGGVAGGRPRPSAIRLVKRALVALVEAARPLKEASDHARAIATRARLAALRRLYIKPRQRKRRSEHANSVHTLTPTGRDPEASRPRVAASDTHSGPCSHGEPRGARYCALCRRGIAA